MSEQTSGRRRIVARVVPIARIIPAVLPPAKPARTSPQDDATSRGMQARQRIYGAPLAAATRFQRPAQRAGRIAFQNMMAGSVAAIDSHTIDLPAGRGEIDEAGLMDEIAPLILWEQPPQPRNWSPPDMPRWVENVSLVPSEQEFSALSAYLVLLIGGFAKFCLAPAVIESGCWQARLPMPPAVLPETTLDVNLSPLLAQLRFETQHLISRDLLDRYVGGLKLQLREALGHARDVEVSLW